MEIVFGYLAEGKKDMSKKLSICRKLKSMYSFRYNKRIIKNSAFFDAEWYKDKYKLGEDENPIEHYLGIGWEMGFDPSETFLTNTYLEINRDVKEQGINPLLHYEKEGKKEQRKYSYNETELMIRNSDFFNYEWYKKKYKLSENENPIEHYLEIGWKMGYDPSEKFSTNIYLEINRDVKEQGVNPLLHYEKEGKNEQRKYSYNETEFMIRNSDFFNYEWYKKKYKLSENENPIEHYLETGWKMGYDPSPWFSTKGYLSLNQDIADKGVNPLLHYELYGKKEFRLFKCVEGLEEIEYE